MKYIFLAILCFTSVSFAKSSKCTLSESETQNFLKMDFKDFDQTLGGGWRKFADTGCNFEAAQLIDLYREKHSKVLQAWEIRTLHWHAGQSFAFADNYKLALLRFEKAYNSEDESKVKFKWNAYVAASIAFLKADYSNLTLERNKLAEYPDDNKPNLTIVENMIKCFSDTYKEVCTGEPIAKCKNQHRIKLPNLEN